MNEQQLRNAFAQIEIDDEAIDRLLKHASAYHPQNRSKRKMAIPIGATVACALMIAMAIPLFNSHQDSYFAWENTEKLPHSSANITVREARPRDHFSMSMLLTELTEEELFFNSKAIYMGTIVSIKTIEVLAGNTSSYFTVAAVEVENTYRGTLKQGEIATILIDYPIALDDGTSISVEDTDTISAMREGMRGIFLLRPFEPDEVGVYNEYDDGSKLYKGDLAQYYFPDGERYAILETGSGLLFSQYGPERLFGNLTSGSTLEEAGNYVEKMTANAIEKLPKQYSIYQAIDDGCYVENHGVIYNGEVMEDFLDQVKQHETSIIRKVSVTIEGDCIVEDIYYRSATVVSFEVTTDSTRNRSGKGTITSKRYKNLFTYEDDAASYVVLTNQEEFTEEVYAEDGESVVIQRKLLP